jgi:ribose/xylose/arabinose/galactoside ABC-type transport system permease subunit
VSILSPTNLSSMAVFAVEIGIIAFGQTLVIGGGGGGIDLSVGAIASLSQVVMGLLMTHGVPWPLGVIAALLLGAAAGVLNGAAIAFLGVPAIIVTLATMFSYGGIALVLTGGVNVDLTGSPAAFLAIGQGHLLGIPAQVLGAWLPLLLLFIYLQHFTRFGRAHTLIGTNELAARLTGLRVARLRFLTYVITGTLAAAAGVIEASRLGTASAQAAEDANLISIAIAVLGGTSIFGGEGSVLGTALATLVIGVLDYGLSYNDFNPIFQAGAMGLILVAAVLVENLIRPALERRRVARGLAS